MIAACPVCKTADNVVRMKSDNVYKLRYKCNQCNRIFNIVLNPAYVTVDDAFGYTIVFPFEDYEKLVDLDDCNSL